MSAATGDRHDDLDEAAQLLAFWTRPAGYAHVSWLDAQWPDLEPAVRMALGWSELSHDNDPRVGNRGVWGTAAVVRLVSREIERVWRLPPTQSIELPRACEWAVRPAPALMRAARWIGLRAFAHGWRRVIDRSRARVLAQAFDAAALARACDEPLDGVALDLADTAAWADATTLQAAVDDFGVAWVWSCAHAREDVSARLQLKFDRGTMRKARTTPLPLAAVDRARIVAWAMDAEPA